MTSIRRFVCAALAAMPFLVAPWGMAWAQTASSWAESEKTSLWSVIGPALLGGLILNLMPSVLAVFSIRLLGAAGNGGRDDAPVRLGFMANAAGILASFLVLALVLIGLKAAGATVGWGVQFQSTWFLISMMILVVLYACNLWGFFEVHFSTRTGNFLTGAFAALLAMPFPAPFLGSAVGLALARGPVEILVIFLAIAMGLAAPYLAVAAFPGLIAKLPAPGRWMGILKGVFGLALVGTAIWLQSVLPGAAGSEAAALVGGIMIAIVTVLYLLTWAGPNPKLTVSAVSVLVGMAFLSPLITVDAPPRAAPLRDAAALDGIWRPFDEEAIPTLLAQGKTVFVDVTAQWCVTCKANKRLVLSDPSVLRRLKEGNVIAMGADWTLPDARISDYLARFGRDKIPFNAAYGPGAPKGIILPEILTKGRVLDTLAKAEKR